jgi:hypothetical protein
VTLLDRHRSCTHGLFASMAACPIPPSDLEQAAIALMRQRSLNDNASLDQRLAAIEGDAARVRAIRDDDEILAKSKTLAAATIRAIERREANA